MRDFTFLFRWVPAHVAIKSIETADKTVNQACNPLNFHHEI